jgi:hypothetical protein
MTPPPSAPKDPSVITCITRTPCSECHFVILPGDDMVLGDWGWAHVICQTGTGAA